MKPAAPRAFARAGLIAAWFVFWLNAALFPCCESIAAMVADHSGNATQSASPAQALHHSDGVHAEGSNQQPSSPCDQKLGAGSAIVGEYEAPASGRFHLQWLAADAGFAHRTTLASHSANLQVAQTAAPPPLRLHLRTQRLLI